MSPIRAHLAPIAALIMALSGCSAAQPGPPTPPPSTPVASPRVTTTGSPATPSAGAPTTPAPGTPSASTPADSPSTAAVRVVLRRSGGIAGQHRTVTVERDGRWTAVDHTGARRSGRLDAADLDRLRRLAADPGLRNVASPKPDGHCADAFAYRLTVGATVVNWLDCPTAGAPPRAASALAGLIEETTG
ncbi:hypothetical protein ACFY2R_12060 [Micromonospora olivasterospora]|uniref:Uncharacterized protein n=1 Tax=Micromonospora olivasterospora TaxID=1880 RepID=A0A562I8B3_MICOL|nr:hypothetical protein [Micromonospora olivasterospora]TWH66904.1 hypothetical protein JD77_01863 [Micromonospora olivasterospora]